MIMEKEKTTWDFVEMYYPGYYSSDKIAANDDLSKLVDGDAEPGSCAFEMLEKEYGGDFLHPQLLIDYNESMVAIYEKSIQSFLAVHGGLVKSAKKFEFSPGDRVVGVSKQDKEFGVMTVKCVHADGNVEMVGIETWFQVWEVQRVSDI